MTISDTLSPTAAPGAAARPFAGPAPAGRALPYPLALDALHERTAPGRLVASPTGHLLASPGALPHAPAGPLARFGLAVADADPTSAFGAGATADRFADGLLALHREVLRDTLHQAMRHLEARTSAGTTLLNRQLVQGELADAAMRLAEEDTIARLHAERADADRPARWRAHLRLVEIGRGLLRLFGASGFLADGPAGPVHLAEIAGNVYLHEGTEDPDA